MKKFLTLSYLILLTLSALVITCSSVGLSVFIVISLGFYFFLITFFSALTGRIKTALLISSTFIIILQLINQLKVHYYKERLFFPDIYVALDPYNFETLLYYPSALIALIFLFTMLVSGFFIFYREKKLTIQYRLISFFLSLLFMTLVVMLSQNKNTITQWESFLPKGRGTIVNLFISAHQSTYTPPFYAEISTYFSQQLNATPSYPASKPDIVAFLQESTVNPQFFTFNHAALPELAIFSPIAATIANNLLRVETFGGGTWLTEFSFLTGLNSNDFTFRKNAVFYTIAPNIQTSLFKELKNNGYFTVVLTPMNDLNYNAGNAYRNFGIDLILQPQNLGYPADLNENLWKIPTQTLLDYVRQILETYTDKPLFIYVLSMYEHGPYDENHADEYQITAKTNDKHFAGKFNDYLGRIKLLNQAVINFSDYLATRQKPTLFLYFGDHQPALEWQGTYQTSLPNGNYLTQFFLQSYGDHSQKIAQLSEVTDIAFLGGLLLEYIHADLSPFYQANIKMRYLCQGKLIDCADQKLVDSYKHTIYQDIKNAGN